MPTFLLKAEPGEYSYADLEREQQTTWSGVKNPAALITLRSMKKGDCVLIYHTGNEKSIVGLARVSRGAYEDPRNPGLNERGEPKFAVVDLTPVSRAGTPVTLARIRADKRFANLSLVKQTRLSAMPIPADLDKVLRAWAGWL